MKRKIISEIPVSSQCISGIKLIAFILLAHANLHTRIQHMGVQHREEGMFSRLDGFLTCLGNLPLNEGTPFGLLPARIGAIYG